MPTRSSEKLTCAEIPKADPGAPSRSVVHSTFDLERTYDAPVARVS